MKKGNFLCAFLTAAALTLAAMPGEAAFFESRLGVSYGDNSVRGTVNKEGKLADFEREVWGHHMAVEVQHLQGEENWYLHIQDPTRDRGKDMFGDVTLQQKDKSWPLAVMTPDPDGTLPPSFEGMDHWYLLPQELVDAMAASPKGWKLSALKEDGKKMTHDFNNVAGKVSLMAKEPGIKASYGPNYSVYFEGVSPEEVQQAFLYHLNVRDTKGEAVSMDGYYRYTQSESPYTVSFTYDYYGSAYSGYVSFYPASGGTFLDMDFWHYFTYRNSNGFGGYYYMSDIRTDVKDEFVNRGFQAVEDAYYDLLPHPDYGIVLAGGFNKSNPKVDSVDTANHPELAAVSKGDWLLSINGMDVTSVNYMAQYALDYAAPGEVLHMTFKNDKTGEYSADVTPVMKERRKAADFSYKDTLDKEGLRLDGIPEQWGTWLPVHEVFAPWNGGGHVSSPYFDALNQALGR